MIKFNNGFATETSTATIYITDNNGLYQGAQDVLIHKGCSVPANSYLDAPPQAKSGFVIMRQADNWVQLADYRGTYYDTTTGARTEWTEYGEIPENLTALVPLDEPCLWDGEKWVIDTDKQAELKAQQQEQMITAINALRNAKNAGGVYVEQLGTWFDSDADAQRRLSGVVSTVTELKEVNPDLAAKIAPDWTDAGNNTVPSLDVAKRALIMLAMTQLEQFNHKVANDHKKAMLECDNPLDYDYSTGWQQTYAEYLSEQEQANG